MHLGEYLTGAASKDDYEATVALVAIYLLVKSKILPKFKNAREGLELYRSLELQPSISPEAELIFLEKGAQTFKELSKVQLPPLDEVWLALENHLFKSF